MKKFILIYGLLLSCQFSLAMKPSPNKVIDLHNNEFTDRINNLPISECEIYKACAFRPKAVLRPKDTSCIFSLLLNTKTNIALIQKDDCVVARVLINEHNIKQIEDLQKSNQLHGIENKNMFVCVGEDNNKIAYEFDTLKTTVNDCVSFKPTISSPPIPTQPNTKMNPPVLFFRIIGAGVMITGFLTVAFLIGHNLMPAMAKKLCGK